MSSISISPQLHVLLLLLLCLFSSFLQLSFSKSRTVTFRASHSATKPLGYLSQEDFTEWFELSTTPITILSLNPGVKSIEETTPGQLRCMLEPIKFPGASVSSTMDFTYTFDGSEFEIRCLDNGLQQTFAGPFGNLLSRLPKPSVVSSSKILFDKEREALVNEATLNISFGLPSWFPMPFQAVEDGGSKAIQDTLESDMTATLDKLLYQFWKANSALAEREETQREQEGKK